MHKTAKLATIAGTTLALLTGAGVGAAAVHPAAATSSSPWSQTDYNAAQSRANLTETTLTVSTFSKIRHLRSVVPPRIGQVSCFSGPKVIAPVLTGGSLYAILNGLLVKADPATGRVVWRSNPSPGFNDDYSSLAVAGGLAIVGGEGCGSADGPQGSIEAFNATTGKLAWSQPMPLGGALQELVVSRGFVLAAGSSDAFGLVVAVLKLTTGANVWTRSVNNCVASQVMVVGQVVITPWCTATTGQVIGRNLTTGKVLWSRTGIWVLQRGDSDTAAGHHVFAIDPGGTVVGLDPLTGKTQYTLTGAANVITVDNARAFGDCGTSVCAYNSATGKLAWSVPSGAAQPALAAEAGGVLYLDHGTALNAATGQTLGTLWTGTAASRAIGDGRIAADPTPKNVGLFGLPGS